MSRESQKEMHELLQNLDGYEIEKMEIEIKLLQVKMRIRELNYEYLKIK